MTEKHSIQPVLEHYGVTNLRQTWGWQKIKCPVHDDATASASVSIEDNAFACHACGVKGDVYKIIMEREGVGFSEAITFAQSIAGDPSAHAGRLSEPSRLGRRTTTSRKYVPPSISRRGRMS